MRLMNGAAAPRLLKPAMARTYNRAGGDTTPESIMSHTENMNRIPTSLGLSFQHQWNCSNRESIPALTVEARFRDTSSLVGAMPCHG